MNKKPLTFIGATAFQWINPKAWVMALTAMAIYVNAQETLFSVVFVSMVFALVNLPCVAI